MEASEEYVRSKWKEVHVRKRRDIKSGMCFLIVMGRHSTLWYGNERAAWSAARAFTEEREREIAEVEEEIAWLNQMKRNLPPGRPTKEERQAILQRILAVEQARLAELRGGMKEGSE